MHDFTWAELGCRIRDRRIEQGLSQQALADKAGITQAGIARIETGQTNPQLETLRQIATALRCSARDLVIGIADSDPALDDRFRRVRRVIESGDNTAIRALDSGIETAEALLERRGGRRGLPPIRLKGEGRRSPADDLFWMKARNGEDQR